MSEAIRFDGQAALVTGAGRGLGRAYARLLAARGAQVVVHDAGVAADGSGSDPAIADAVVEEIRADGGTAAAAYDNLEERAAGEAAVRSALARYGRLDVLVHSAGLAVHAPIEETDDATWERMLRVNAAAAFLLCRAAFPVMRAQRYGRIVLTVSGHGLSPDPSSGDLAAYSLGKGAQFGLMNALAGAGAQSGIRVNAVSPVAATRMYTRAVAPGELSAAHVAPGVVYLASSSCDAAGVVLRAANGRFALGGYAGSTGADFGREPVSPEQIAAGWERIAAGLPLPGRS